MQAKFNLYQSPRKNQLCFVGNGFCTKDQSWKFYQRVSLHPYKKPKQQGQKGLQGKKDKMEKNQKLEQSKITNMGQ